MFAMRWLLALLVVASPRFASACSCVGVAPFCQVDFNSLDPSRTTLFIGRVKSVSPKSWQDYMRMINDRLPEELKRMAIGPGPRPVSEEHKKALREARKQILLDLRGGEMTPDEREAVRRAETEEELDDLPPSITLFKKRVEVEVQEVFVGKLGEAVVLHTGMGGGDCGVGFQEGETRLIDADGDGGSPLGVSICSRTQRLEGVSEDLRALRAWKKGGQIPRRVYGVVKDWTTRQNSHPKTHPAVAGLRMRLSGGGKPVEIVTDADGGFWFEDLEAVVYQIEADRPGWHFSRSSEQQLRIDLTQNRCAELFLTIEEDQGVIRGRVLPQSGETLPEYLGIEAIPVDPNHAAPFDAAAKAPDGTFEIDEIEPGDYYVAINVKNAPSGEHNRMAEHGRIWPYPPTYYPGVADRSRATVFHVERGMNAELGDWTLPPRLAERRLSGVVLRPDGSPAADARLILTSPPSKEWITTIGPTGPDGRFEVYVLETISYELKAAYNDQEARIIYTGGVSVVSEATSPVTITLAPDPGADVATVPWIFNPMLQRR